MDSMIGEINNSLRMILEDLEKRKNESASALKEVEKKISIKIDEAKQYKIEVDSTKSKIKSLEEEIASLEIDLSDLNERFGKKDLNAIVEAGNREINSKIMDKQNHITKHRQKIAELTEKARSIKDLLINLRKDKTTKEERLDVLTKSFEYYEKSLDKIIEYAKENPDSLDRYDAYPQTYQNYEYVSEPLVESGIFDEIESMDKEDDDDNEETQRKGLRIKESIFDDNEDDLDDIYKKIKSKAASFEEISESIDKEYENIFGSPGTDFDFTEEEVKETEIEPEKEIELEPEEDAPVAEITEEELNTSINVFENDNPIPTTSAEMEVKTPEEPIKEIEPVMPDIFGNEAPTEESSVDSTEIISLFTEYGLDFNKFTAKDQEYLKNIFNEQQFKNIIEVLKQNHINLDCLYDAANILGDASPDALGKVISGLLLANQTTENIGYVLNKLNLIDNQSLADTIKGYGPNIKDVNIVDILMQAKNASGANSGPTDISYLTSLGFTEEEVNSMSTTLPATVLENLTCFSKIIKTNFEILNAFNISNIKDVFKGHSHMFLLNPEKFNAIFAKYDQEDLVRCLEKNAAVIEKL